MDKVSDLFKELKDRLASPFFGSFIISWLAINWRIVIVLIFYKQSDLKLDHYHSYLEFIKFNSGIWRTLWEPILFALAYTFIYPFFKNFILAATAWFKQWGGTWSLKLSKRGVVPTIKYIGLKEKYDISIDKLSKLINEESETSTALNEAELKNLELQKQILDIKAEGNKFLEYANKLNSPDRVIGFWEFDNPAHYDILAAEVDNIQIGLGKINFYRKSDFIITMMIDSSLGDSEILILLLNSGINVFKDLEPLVFKVQNRDQIQLKFDGSTSTLYRKS
ncbi:hypothetical protein [Mucilaginibacter sp. KACC 22063]|uniref:hypothetical protein n=1 Tax=Mucilaginibacter sp. KACC 22063 TaxID=3025666 RepID=UPI002365F66F|nr:hypothetical protein [Mucilaginibacter sp. KACC 22063]WDF54160.1 hypothetical protein PQ461_14535 [Mucilaginibacter sp. KACC 22063]